MIDKFKSFLSNQKNYIALYKWIHDNYKKLEKIDCLDAKFYDDSDSFRIAWKNEHLMFKDQGIEHGDQRYVLTDFAIKKGAGTNYYKEYITEADFKKWKDLATEIEEYVYQQQAAEIEAKKVKVGSGDFNMELSDEEVAQMEFSHTLMTNMKNLKNLKFEAEYHLWSAKDKNEKIIQDVEIEITGFKIIHEDLIYAYARCNDPKFVGYLTITSKSPTTYFDFSAHKIHKFNDVILFSKEDEEMTSRDRDKKYKETVYPHIINIALSPCDYNSIEFVTELKSILDAAKSHEK